MGLAAGIISSLRTPVYRATAKVLLTPNDPNQRLNPSNSDGVVGSDADRYVAGQISIVLSEGVATEAVKSLAGVTVKSLETKISVSQTGRSNVLNISANSGDADQARDMADAVANGYIENRRKAAVSGLQGAADDIEARLGPLQTQIAQFDAQIGDGSTIPGASSTLVSPVNPGSSLAPGQPASQVPTAAASRGGAATSQEAVKAARYAAAVQYETLYSRQQELLVDISLKRGDAELIAAAKTPPAPIKPRPKRDAALGVFFGLVVGIGITFLREQLDDKVRSAEEVERLTGLPMIAQLPYDEEQARAGSAVAVVDRSNGPLGEGIRSLRTSIQCLGVDAPVKTIVVTSAVPNEGKSLVAANLAAVFAQADHRTILVSADLRRAAINDAFGDLKPSPGLTGVLAHGWTKSIPRGGQAGTASANGNGQLGAPTEDPATLPAALVKTPIPNLLLLPSGPTPPNPAELLSSNRMATVLAAYSSLADVIIIDTPPLLPVTDAAILATRADGVVLVSALNETRRDATKRAAHILAATGARVLGVVVNKSPKGGGGYYYNTYYGEPRRRNRRAGALRRAKADRSAANSTVPV